jgi:hypothetical protein
VAASAGVVVVPKGIATTKTSAPWTEWFRLSETWNLATIVRRDRSGCGENETRSISSRFGSETSLIETVAPLGASAFATTPDGADVADADPRELRAVTRTRSVVSRSAVVRTYVFAVAELMSAQLPPVRSQRRQRYENVSGCAPAQEPGSAVSVRPTCGVPPIDGAVAFRGAPAVAAERTTSVAFDVALAEPSAFAAVTRTLIRLPTSACRSVYRLNVAPEIAAQPSPLPPPPVDGHRSQRYE